MAARKSPKVNRKYKTQYRVKNWANYEAGLRGRGDVTLWFSEEAIAGWTPAEPGGRGGQRLYSDLAILTSLSLRMIFHLPLRQAEGFVASLIKLMGVGLTAPDHTTLCRRNKTVEVPALPRDHAGPIHLIVDSTGLKIFGDGEWHARKHKRGKARRGWRKLHIGVDDEGFVVAAKLTDNSGDDAYMIPDLLVQLNAPIKRFTGDGAFDRRDVYRQVAEAGTEDVMVVVPPRRSAIPDAKAEGAWAQRNAHLERIGEVGRRAWHKEIGYRKQARVEGTFRYKRTLGGRLRARGFEAQRREAMIGCRVLNRMFELGTPEAYAVVG